MDQPNTLSLQERTDRLAEVGRKVSTCPRCPELVENRTQPVFGAGRLNAKMLFIGEAPGRDEDRQGAPFVGAAGRKLNQLLQTAGIDRNEIYITNTIKCRPPRNRTPLVLEIANCRPYLEQEIELVRPQVLCAMGLIAAQWLLDTKQTLGRLRGRVHNYRDIPVICTYHPAYVIRTPSMEAKFAEDMRRLLDQLP